MSVFADSMMQHTKKARVKNLKHLPKWLPHNVREALASVGFDLWDYDGNFAERLSKIEPKNKKKAEEFLQEYSRKNETTKRLCTDKSNMEFFWSTLSESNSSAAGEIVRSIGELYSRWESKDKTSDFQKKSDLEKLNAKLFEIRAILENSKSIDAYVEQLGINYIDGFQHQKIREMYRFYGVGRNKVTGENLSNFIGALNKMHDDLFSLNSKTDEVLASITPSFKKQIRNMELEIKDYLETVHPQKKRKKDIFAKRRFFIKELYSEVVSIHFSNETKAAQNKLLLCLARTVLDDPEIELKTLDDALGRKALRSYVRKK